MPTDWKQYYAINQQRTAYGTMTGPELLERVATELPRDGRFDDRIKPKMPSAEDRLRRHVKPRAQLR